MGKSGKHSEKQTSYRLTVQVSPSSTQCKTFVKTPTNSKIVPEKNVDLNIALCQTVVIISTRIVNETKLPC